MLKWNECGLLTFVLPSLAVCLFSSNVEVEQVPVEEEVKADNIKDAIKSVIKKSQANDGKHQRSFC